ncbi:unnamed protein product [Prunus armeniaca]
MGCSSSRSSMPPGSKSGIHLQTLLLLYNYKKQQCEEEDHRKEVEEEVMHCPENSFEFNMEMLSSETGRWTESVVWNALLVEL